MDKNMFQSFEWRSPELVQNAHQRKALEEYAECMNEGSKVDTEKKMRELSASTGLSRKQIHAWIRDHKKETLGKARPVHTVRQVQVMEWVFVNYSQYPSPQLKMQMAEYLKMLYSQVQKWFQTRRRRGPPVLLSNHENNREEMETIVNDIRKMIKEAVSLKMGGTENLEIPSKKRKIDETLESTSPSVSPLPSSSSSASSTNSILISSSLQPSSTPSSSSSTYPASTSSTSSALFTSFFVEPSPPSVKSNVSHSTRPFQQQANISTPNRPSKIPSVPFESSPLPPLSLPPPPPLSRETVRLPSIRDLIQNSPPFYSPPVAPWSSDVPYFPFGVAQPSLPPFYYPPSNTPFPYFSYNPQNIPPTPTYLVPLSSSYYE